MQRLTSKLLRLLCRPEVVEDLEGDLFELHEERLRHSSSLKAHLLLVYDTLRSLRPWALRRSIPTPTSPFMIQNYLSVSLRHQRRHPGISFIKISGLAVGVAVALFALLYASHEQSYDRFQENGDRIARISMTWVFGETRFETALSTTLPGPTIAERQTYVEDYVRFRRVSESYFLHDGQFVREAGLVHADPAVFTLFSFPLLHGNPDEVLVGPGRIVLSASKAESYFGRTNVMGETMLLGGSEAYEVTGVMADLPATSHIQFDMVASFSTPEADKRAFDNSSYHTYVLLASPADMSRLEGDLMAGMVAAFGADNPSMPILHVTPFNDIYLHSRQPSEWTPAGDIRFVRLFLGIGALILLIAGINYTNLSTARSIYRSREVGMRKVLGAESGQVFLQFLSEALLTTLFALLMGMMLAVMALPFYNSFTGQTHEWGALFQPGLLVILWLVLGVLAGAYPAFVLAHVLPARVLKGSASSSGKGILLRRSLVVVQFAVTFLLIAGTVTIQRQLSFMQTKELGYDQSQLMAIPIDRELADRSSSFTSLLSSQPVFQAVSATSHRPSGGAGARTFRSKENPEDRQLLNTIQIDEGWVGTSGVTLVAGRPPTAAESDRSGEAERAILLNESALELFGWSAEEALDKVMFSAGVGADVRIVGVVEDFHYSPLHNPIEPLVLVASRDARYVLTRFEGSPLNAVEQAETAWNEAFPDRPFDFSFTDDRLTAQYASERQMADLFFFFSAIAIIIACLGLVGLAAFVVVQKTREIGIRKVLGASTFGLSTLVAREFIILVGGALVLAGPLAYWMLSSWLQGYAYHVNVSTLSLVLSGALSLLIALGTVSWQSWRAAQMDPVVSLKTEG